MSVRRKGPKATASRVLAYSFLILVALIVVFFAVLLLYRVLSARLVGRG